MKRWMRVAVAVICVIMASSVGAGIADRKEQKEREKEADKIGERIHKPYGIYEKYVKRPLDFILSVVALFVLSPIMLAVAALVRIKLGKPVIFRQERPGKNEKIFTLFKYRSMSNKRDEEGNLLSDEERLTGFGKALRSSSMDELPELWNILTGQMSLVGPRPLLVEYLPRYSEEQRHRHDVRPGLTGLAQISGRNSISWEERFEEDVEYVKKITFLGDVRIIFGTIVQVLRRDGISSATSATMEKFESSNIADRY